MTGVSGMLSSCAVSIRWLKFTVPTIGSICNKGKLAWWNFDAALAWFVDAVHSSTEPLMVSLGFQIWLEQYDGMLSMAVLHGAWGLEPLLAFFLSQVCRQVDLCHRRRARRSQMLETPPEVQRWSG